MARKVNAKVVKLPKIESVKEFKAWLAGLLAFQPADWIPNVEQWKSIQDMINNLEDVIVPPTPSPQQVPVIQRAPTAQPQPQPASAFSQLTQQWTPSEVPDSLMGRPSPNPNFIMPLPDDSGEQFAPIPILSQPTIETISSTVKVSGGKAIKLVPTAVGSGLGEPYKSPF